MLSSTHPLDRPLAAPISPTLTWHQIHQMSQIPLRRQEPGPAAMITDIRRTATVVRGTPMVKVLTAKQVAGYLGGWPLTGFCFREYDLAHLRTPAELAPLNGSPQMSEDVVFVVRWRAIDPLDYVIPLDAAIAPLTSGEVDVTGLADIPPSDRIGPQILGTGFAPTRRHIIPEWMVADFADLAMTAGMSILAYLADGTEVVLFTYQPEHHSWIRLAGPQWRHLLSGLTPSGSVGQEFFPVPTTPTRLVGHYQGQMVQAVADPPSGFRVAAKARADRHTVDALARRTRYTLWRGTLCTVNRLDGDWRQVRLCHPDTLTVQFPGVDCVERGVYEAWVPATETTGERDVDLWYDLS